LTPTLALYRGRPIGQSWGIRRWATWITRKGVNEPGVPSPTRPAGHGLLQPVPDHSPWRATNGSSPSAATTSRHRTGRPASARHRKQLIRENRVDGLASPSATAVRGDRLYITDGGVAEPHDAKLQIGRINVAALFVGAAH
jgi:hypothetical protein